jgi:PKD repeat protein
LTDKKQISMTIQKNKHPRFYLSGVILCLKIAFAHAQCANTIQNFPYRESFEQGDGGWTSGGTENDWSLGTPAKMAINTAADGQQCWISGGLSGSFYNYGEASFVESPCFNFSSLDHPYISVWVWWETEYKFDGTNLQYSTDNGNAWITIGSSNESASCYTQNWYNHAAINYLSPLTTQRSGWTGNQAQTSGCNNGNGSGTWVQASHCLPQLAGKPAVRFRFAFGAGTLCNDYEGFAFDNITIENTRPISADFVYACSPSKSNTIAFRDSSTNCPESWFWDFGDPASGSNNTSAQQHPTHTFSKSGEFVISQRVTNGCSRGDTIVKTIKIMDIQATVSPESTCGAADGQAEIAVADGISPYTYQWSQGAFSGNAARGLSQGAYTVTVTDVNRCSTEKSIQVGLADTSGVVYIPNIFKPESFTLNDHFTAFSSACGEEIAWMAIYDRWGNLVFERRNIPLSDPDSGWDGRFNSKNALPGVYMYIIDVQLFGGSIKRFYGDVTVIR